MCWERSPGHDPNTYYRRTMRRGTAVSRRVHLAGLWLLGDIFLDLADIQAKPLP